jgi:tetratricopeptide (TPR) repeat protein
MTGREDAMVVRVSPAGKTLRIAGSAGVMVGGSVDALVNDRYRQVIKEATGEWDSAETVEGVVAQRLEAAVGANLTRVPSASSTAGVASIQEAEQARYNGLKQQGYEALLDIDMSHGLFGPAAEPVVVLNSRLIGLDNGALQWRRELVASSSPVLTTDPLRNPIGRLKPTIANPRLRVEAQAVEWLVSENAAPLKREIEAAAEAAAAMLLTALNVEESFEGRYQLGRMALFNKELDAAAQQFERALALRHDAPEAVNALAVTRAHQGNLEQALELGRNLAEKAPDFAPIHYNLAWWLADKGEVRQAREHYRKARELGLGADEALEKRVQDEAS